METKQILESYKTELGKMLEKIKECFWSKAAIKQTENYIEALLSPIERKNGWQIAEARGEKTPYKIQQFLYRGSWQADELRDKLQDYVKENIGEDEGVLIVDETGFLKKGTKSVGVKRQYSGTAGRVENCQVGVFMTYASSKGFTMIDRQLYLPKEWMEDSKRCREAGIPDGVKFKTKPRMALSMLKIANERNIPFSWVTGDSVYGDFTGIRYWLEQEGKGYVMAVSGKSYVWQGDKQHKIGTIIKNLTEDDWIRMSCGEGSKGQRLYDWKAITINQPENENFKRLLLIRRSISSPEEIRAFLCFFPAATDLQRLVEIAGIRWTVEQSFQESKGEVGLDQYEVRSYNGWYKHISLAMCAHALLAVIKDKLQSEEGTDSNLLFDVENGSMNAFKKGHYL